MPDRTLICQDCSREFVFTEGEQEFYKEKGLQNEPKRCPECRKAKKAQFNRNRRRQSNQIVSNLLTPLLKCSGVFVFNGEMFQKIGNFCCVAGGRRFSAI